jgi:16S rRNA (guanine527-N7)-methyltransferase
MNSGTDFSLCLVLFTRVHRLKSVPPNASMNFDSQQEEFRAALAAEGPRYGLQLQTDALEGLTKYYELLNRWNARLHLVAPTSPREFATRHVLESLLMLEHLPIGASVADIGSGAGLPVIPCMIVRPDLEVLLIEASKKKSVFLREAVREVLDETSSAQRRIVIGERFENVPTPDVGFVTCRALEHFEEMLPKLIKWAPGTATLLFFGGEGLGTRLKETGLAYNPTLIPNSERRFLFVAIKV